MTERKRYENSDISTFENLCNSCGGKSIKKDILTIKMDDNRDEILELALCKSCVKNILNSFSYIPEKFGGKKLVGGQKLFYLSSTEDGIKIITSLPSSKKELRNVGRAFETYYEAEAERKRLAQDEIKFYVVKDGKYKGVHVGEIGFEKIKRTKYKVYKTIEAANAAYAQFKLNLKIKKSKEKKIFVVTSGSKIGIYRGISGAKEVVGEGYSEFVSKKDAESYFKKSMYSKFFLVRNGSAIGELYNGADVYDVIGRSKFNIYDDLESARIAQKKIVKRPITGVCTDGSYTQLEHAGDFRTVFIETGEEIFHSHEIKGGTSSAMEYLALVHTIKYCQKHKIQGEIYSDCQGVIDWVRMRTHRIKLVVGEENSDLARMLRDAHSYIRGLKRLPIIKKWHTSLWGEIPADFGRKKQPKLPNEKFSLICVD